MVVTYIVLENFAALKENTMRSAPKWGPNADVQVSRIVLYIGDRDHRGIRVWSISFRGLTVDHVNKSSGASHESLYNKHIQMNSIMMGPGLQLRPSPSRLVMRVNRPFRPRQLKVNALAIPNTYG